MLSTGTGRALRYRGQLHGRPEGGRSFCRPGVLQACLGPHMYCGRASDHRLSWTCIRPEPAPPQPHCIAACQAPGQLCKEPACYLDRLLHLATQCYCRGRRTHLCQCEGWPSTSWRPPSRTCAQTRSGSRRVRWAARWPCAAHPGPPDCCCTPPAPGRVGLAAAGALGAPLRHSPRWAAAGRHQHQQQVAAEPPAAAAGGGGRPGAQLWPHQRRCHLAGLHHARDHLWCPGGDLVVSWH